MERRFGHDFGRIRIHTDPPAARAAAALGAEAFTVGHHIAFGRARFLPDTAHGKRLVAHELTHTIQQAATSPHIALRPEKRRAAPAPRSSQFDGVLLGTDRNKQEVRVKREVGGTQGYDHRLQAMRSRAWPTRSPQRLPSGRMANGMLSRRRPNSLRSQRAATHPSSKFTLYHRGPESDHRSRECTD